MSRTEGTELKEIPVHDAVCQFALRRAIDGVLDDLIVAGADKVMLLRDNRDERSKKLSMSRSQIKNVVSEAAEQKGPLSVTNFIRYQMGRQGGRPWRWQDKAKTRKAFGQEIIADIEGAEGNTGVIDNATRSVCKRVIDELRYRRRTTDQAELERAARSQLIALYLGYISRTYSYCEAMDEEDKSCWDDVERIAKQKGGAV